MHWVTIKSKNDLLTTPTLLLQAVHHYEQSSQYPAFLKNLQKSLSLLKNLILAVDGGHDLLRLSKLTKLQIWEDKKDVKCCCDVRIIHILALIYYLLIMHLITNGCLKSHFDHFRTQTINHEAKKCNFHVIENSLKVH